MRHRLSFPLRYGRARLSFPLRRRDAGTESPVCRLALWRHPCRPPALVAAGPSRLGLWRQVPRVAWRTCRHGGVGVLFLFSIHRWSFLAFTLKRGSFWTKIPEKHSPGNYAKGTLIKRFKQKGPLKSLQTTDSLAIANSPASPRRTLETEGSLQQPQIQATTIANETLRADEQAQCLQRGTCRCAMSAEGCFHDYSDLDELKLG